MKDPNRHCPFYLKESESLPNQQDIQSDMMNSQT